MRWTTMVGVTLVFIATACGAKKESEKSDGASSSSPRSTNASKDGLPDDPKALVELARKVALPFCQKPLLELTEKDMPHFGKLTGIFRSPRSLDKHKPADQEFVFAGRSAFVERDDGEVQLIVTSKTSDPCKADLGRRLTEKQDEPVATFEIKKPNPGLFVFTFGGDGLAEGKYEQVIAEKGWPVVEAEKAKQISDFDFFRGEVLFRITRYEKGKVLEGELMACGDPYLLDAKDGPEKLPNIKEFVIGPITASLCPPT